MKALAGLPSAAKSLVDDDSLQLLFQIVANGSTLVFSQYKEDLVPVHAIQLHRQATQILALLLINDNGSVAKYIRKHHLIKVLLMAIKDFNPDYGDPNYTLGIVELLLLSVELSYRPEAGGIRLNEDIHNAHGYNFLVQFSLILSKKQSGETFHPKPFSESELALDSWGAAGMADRENSSGNRETHSPHNLSPALSRLLDIIITFAQTGPSSAPSSSESKASKSSHAKPNEHGRSHVSAFDSVPEKTLEKDSEKIKDLEAVQVLQDIIIKAESGELQTEVLNRLLKIFSSHAENYKLCQQLRTVPLLILNMASFHSSLRETILKILEYVVSVLNIVPEQELLSLCCLIQQSVTSELKHTILSFFLKLLSFDQHYKNILREVGVMELLLDDLKQNKFLLGPDRPTDNHNNSERKSSPSRFHKRFHSDDTILNSPNLLDSFFGRALIFEEEGAIEVAWDCLVSLLKKADVNQSSFRSANGLTIILPFLASDIHRPGVLRVLSCLIMEDANQVHPDELASLIEILKSGMITSVFGSQYALQHDAECDIFGVLWRILRSSRSAQRVFGEAAGFSLLVRLQQKKQPSITVYMKLFTYMMRVMTAGVCDNAVNRSKVHGILSSSVFYELLCNSQLICAEWEWQVIQLMLELALEVVNPPFMMSEHDNVKNESPRLPLFTLSGSWVTHKARVYSAVAIKVLLHTLLFFTPKVQIQFLTFIEKLACANSFNKENLTSVGCVELLLETLYPLMLGSTSIITYALKIVEVLGAYRLSVSELKSLVRYILQRRLAKSGCCLVGMMERLILSEDTGSEGVSLAPFIELDTSKLGHASIQVSLGARTWPPAAGYSFVCWFRYQKFKPPAKDTEASKTISPKRHKQMSVQGGVQVIRLFSVGAVDNGSTFYADLCLHDDGILTLATSNSSSLTFPGLEMEEGKWHHLAVVHTKPNALAGLFQASFAYVYLNGKLRHTGKLGYSPSPPGKYVHVAIGASESRARVNDFSWKLRSCHLFDEVLSPGSICFMYILGRGYRGLYQDTNLLQFVPNQACGGDSMAILDSLESDLLSTSNVQRPETGGKQGITKMDGSGFVWDSDKLAILSLQLCGKKLIFAFSGTCPEIFRSPGSLSILNLVDPMSAAASPIGGIPRFGHLLGDAYVSKQYMISDTIRPLGGMAVVLALIEASDTRDMLHMSLTFLACVLHQSPRNVRDMQKCRGYHLLALFIHQRMSLFDIKLLEIFFRIAACEATFSEPRKTGSNNRVMSPSAIINETSFEDLNLSKFTEEFSSVESLVDIDDFLVPKESFSHTSELENADMLTETSNSIVLSNADMVEHVLLDWTVWVGAPVSVQISLLGFLENLVSVHWYRNHNLTILRKINLVQHLLVTLQRGDVEVPVLEHIVVLLGSILADGLLPSELELVVRFLIMTFDPPEPASRNQITRESMGKHVIVRNMLLEMLIDLQVTIQSEELLDQWHKIVSSRLITYFLDEAVHPTSMRWIMTLLGVCLSSFSAFAVKFRSGGGYQGLARVLPSFYDSPDIYYILFCLIFGKPVYPRLPEVRMLDFHALMPSDAQYGELKFVELLDSVIAMTKSTFDRLCVQSMAAHETGNLSQVGAGIAAELVNELEDMAGELQGEALMHKTYAARLMGGEASAPTAATSVLRFMVDLAKMCPPFSALCRRAEFLESCIDLYFSCVRAVHAVNVAKELTLKTEDKNLNDVDDAGSSPNTFASLPPEQDQLSKIYLSCAPGNVTASSEDIPIFQGNVTSEKPVIVDLANQQEMDKIVKEDLHDAASPFSEKVGPSSSSTPCSNELGLRDMRSRQGHIHRNDLKKSMSFSAPKSSTVPESPNTKMSLAPSSVLASPSLLRISSHGDLKVQSFKAPSVESFISLTDTDSSSDVKSVSHAQYAPNTVFAITPKLLLEVDNSGYGGGPCSAGATAVLDCMAEVLSDVVTEQMKAIPVLEGVLESVPLYADAESVLVFQGLCLTRMMNFLERRLLRDDEENDKKLDKSRWSINLDALSWLIVDRVYMGAFPQPSGLLKTLEFLLSMLQLANKDGRVEETVPSGKGFLSLARGSRQLDTYVQALIKNMNRMILYCFLPSFLHAIGEGSLLTNLGVQYEPQTKLLSYSSLEDGGIDIITVLQLLVAHRRIIFCPCNRDNDLNSCLCVNLISLLHDNRRHVQNSVIDILKYLLVHRRAAFEEFFVSKSNQGPTVDVLHGGFDQLLTGNLTEFFEWFQSYEKVINKAVEQSAAVMWRQYIAAVTKLPATRIKGMENRRKREMGRKSRDVSKLEQRHWEVLNERRNALLLVHDAMATELRVIRQDRYGWVVHAESEWLTHHLQQLVHERGIFPMNKSSMNKEEPEWQLCPIEGPYRMRKRLERCKPKIETIQNVLDGQFEIGGVEWRKENTDNEHYAFDIESDAFLNISADKPKEESFNVELYNEPSLKESDDVADAASGFGWNDDAESSVNEASLHSAPEFGIKSSDSSSLRTETVQGKPDLGSSRVSTSVNIEEVRVLEEKSDKDLNDNGENLIRPYLEPFDIIRHKYNCERVVGLDKHDGIFLIGESSLYIIENFYINESGCICEKESEEELSVIDQALGVQKDISGGKDSLSKSTPSWGATVKPCLRGRAWAYDGGAWGRENLCSTGNMAHHWRRWKLDSVHELLKRDYQLRPVAIEIFSTDGCNGLLVFHKKEREEVFKSLLAMNLPRSSILDATITGSTKQESNEGGRLYKSVASSLSKRWQNGEISNFQYIMHLNTMAGRGYSDLTQYPVFPWILADYESENLDLSRPSTFRNLQKPMGCQTSEGEEEFRRRYESWDDPEIPKFHYGSHYSSAGIVLFYLLRLPPFSDENQKLQGGQFDHADRLFNSVQETWVSAAGRGNTSDVKELIPEFFYLPEFLENKFNLDFGEKQSGEKVGDVALPPWAKGSAREFIRKHREALECDYVSEHLHHWIDLIFGSKQRGKAAEEAANVFYHYTYEGSVDIDSIKEPVMKASILAQINHFGQTPKQLFLRPHAKRRTDRKLPPHPLRHSTLLTPHEIRKNASAISQIVIFNDKILIASMNHLLKPRSYTKCLAWGFPDRSLRFLSYGQDRLLSTHEDLHSGNQIQCVGASQNGQILVTGGDDSLICIWRFQKDGTRGLRRLQLERSLCGHTGKITCLHISQPYMMIVSGSDDCSVIIWDLSSLTFLRQLPEFPSPISAIFMNDMTGEIAAAAGVVLTIWSINGDCLAVVNASHVQSDSILSLAGSTFSDWMETIWFVSGHQSGDIKVWKMIHSSSEECAQSNQTESPTGGLKLGSSLVPEYRLVLHKVLKSHKCPVTALRFSNDLKQLISGDSGGHLLSWTLRDDSFRFSMKRS